MATTCSGNDAVGPAGGDLIAVAPSAALGRLALASTWARSRAPRPWTLWVIAFGCAAVTVTMLNARGVYVFDNRFEQYWNPAQRVGKNVTVWDGTRGLGRVREEFWPLATVPMWLFGVLGASPATIERLWHASLLWAAAAGTMVLVRRFVPGSVAIAVLAGAVYAYGPYSSVFLTPSTLYMYYALTPWFAYAVIRSVESPTPWRPAAGLALLVFGVGNADPPALTYALVPIAISLVYLVSVERSATVRDVAAGLARGALLVSMTSAAMVAKTYISAEAFAQRLYSTESPEVAGSASSWGESFRGMGFWVSYLRDRGDLIRPHEQQLFADAWVVLATFLLPLGALMALWALRDRVRLLFGTLLGVGTAVMVGPYPLDDSSPWGRAWLWAAREVPGFAALRSTYKVGSSYALGTAALFAIGVAVAAGSFPSQRTAATVRGDEEPSGGTRRRLCWAAGAGVVVLAAVPFWSGNLYDPVLRLDDGVPDYWLDAMEWLDAQDGDTRVMTFPGLTRARYRWGAPGDDIADAHLARPHAENIAIPLTTPAPADLLEAIDAGVADADYVHGSVAPILRRIGVEFVLVRNDLMWEEVGVARPTDYEGLRSDPDMVPVASFGRPGENTVGVVTSLSAAERRLPPVQIYRVADAPATLSRATSAPWALLDGGGQGWWRLAESGALAGDEPVVYPASIGDDLLVSRLAAGDRLFVTDTNRRSAQSVYVYSADRSWTLADGEDFGRGIPDLFGLDGSQTVAAVDGDASIRDVDAELALISGFRPGYRASQAFDGDLATGWTVSPTLEQTGRALRVELPGGRSLAGVDVTAFDPLRPERAERGESFTKVPRIARLSVRLSGGEEHQINMITGRGAVSFPPTSAEWIELTIEDVTANRHLGIAEVRFEGLDLDLAERIRLPDLTFRRAASNPELRDVLARSNVTYSFEREVGSLDAPVEAQMRREFETVGTRSFQVAGSASWPLESSRSIARSCGNHGLSIDGRSVSIRATATGFMACDEVVLGPGTHRLEGRGAFVIDAVSLETGSDSEPRPDEGGRAVLSAQSADGRRTIEIGAGDEAVLVGGDGYDPRWSAAVGATELGRPMMADAQTAWVVPAGADPAVVEATFEPAGLFRAALGITAMSVVLCLVLLFTPPRRRGLS